MVTTTKSSEARTQLNNGLLLITDLVLAADQDEQRLWMALVSFGLVNQRSFTGTVRLQLEYISTCPCSNIVVVS